VAASQVLEDRSVAHTDLVIVLVVEASADLNRHVSVVPASVAMRIEAAVLAVVVDPAGGDRVGSAVRLALAARADSVAHRAIGTKPVVVVHRIVVGLALAERRDLTVALEASADLAYLVASTVPDPAIVASALGRGLLASTATVAREAPDATVCAPDSAVQWIAATR
jgi:hypothetical protein